LKYSMCGVETRYTMALPHFCTGSRKDPEPGSLWRPLCFGIGKTGHFNLRSTTATGSNPGPPEVVSPTRFEGLVPCTHLGIDFSFVRLACKTRCSSPGGISARDKTFPVRLLESGLGQGVGARCSAQNRLRRTVSRQAGLARPFYRYWVQGGLLRVTGQNKSTASGPSE